MVEFSPTKLKKEIAERLVQNGVTEEEAQQIAAKEVESMGMYKIATGNCPLVAVSPLACMFCEYGHMLDCHYPHDCKEAECSHYQVEGR
ncbi:hypothetical protein ES703_74136 [subsurface metagenome]